MSTLWSSGNRSWFLCTYSSFPQEKYLPMLLLCELKSFVDYEYKQLTAHLFSRYLYFSSQEHKIRKMLESLAWTFAKILSLTANKRVWIGHQWMNELMKTMKVPIMRMADEESLIDLKNDLVRWSRVVSIFDLDSKPISRFEHKNNQVFAAIWYSYLCEVGFFCSIRNDVVKQVYYRWCMMKCMSNRLSNCVLT